MYYFNGILNASYYVNMQLTLNGTEYRACARRFGGHGSS